MRRRQGVTFLELIMVLGLLAVLGAASVPLVDIVEMRAREKRLQQTLDDTRAAIDRYHRRQLSARLANGLDPHGPASWPTDLAALVAAGDLASMPANPLMPGPDAVFWQVRCTICNQWEDFNGIAPGPGHDVFDLRHPATASGIQTAIDGSRYADW